MTKPVRKKLIEVALPLEAINEASAREKSIRHGHPSTLHLWWARRPLAAARAVIFAQMVDDPSSWPDLFPTEKAQEKERQRLFKIIEDLVQWENTTNETVLQQARDEIWRSWRRTCAENADHPRAKELFNRDKLPGFHDPFAGGGALPLEAQRLGLEAYASDLNPVAVLINKAMIEIPPKFAGQPPVNPDAQSSKHLSTWQGAQGLAEDVRYYGQWMRDEAEKRIGHLYPKVKVTPEMVSERSDLKPYLNRELTAVAWIWARTVKSPNPAFRNVDVPLASTFMLSRMNGNEAYVEPEIEGKDYRFKVKMGIPKDSERVKRGTKLARGANFECVLSSAPITADYIKAEGVAGRMGAKLMAIVAEGDRGRVYLSPTLEHEGAATRVPPSDEPDGEIPPDRRSMFTPLYGLTHFRHLFTPRQLTALTTFSDLVVGATQEVRLNAVAVGMPDDSAPQRECGVDALAYAHAVSVYLGFVISSQTDRMSTICTWDAGGPTWGTKTRNTFARQAIPMSWDFAEVNPFSTQSGSFNNSLDYTAKGVVYSGGPEGKALRADAATQSISLGRVVSTDPPYYDNIGYADLSEYFYVWLRRALRGVYPDLFATIAVPKAEELVAIPYRHGGKEAAERFFLDGMTGAMHRLCEQSHPVFPVTIYYAFKQSESTDSGGQVSTGWETFLEAVVRSGFTLTGTWPMRTELGNRMIGSGTNALASSIVLVCRRRDETATSATRREFLTALQRELPRAIGDLQRGNIAPVDLKQAAIGPGMAIFTRYSQVLDAEGKLQSVKDALSMISAALDETLSSQDSDFDSQTRWALEWFEEFGFEQGDFDTAMKIARTRNVGVDGIVEAGIAVAGKGKVRLLKPEELPENWIPEGDKRLTVWDTVHHLIRILDKGEAQAAHLLAKLGSNVESARELAYRLYSICDRTKRSQDAQRYNGLVQSWPEIAQLSQQLAKQGTEQQRFEGME